MTSSTSDTSEDEYERKKKSEEEENKSEFDLLDEQMVASIQQFQIDDVAGNSLKPIRYESMVFLDQSQWYQISNLNYYLFKSKTMG